MKFVFTGEHKAGIDAVTLERVERASRFLEVKNDRLYITGIMGSR
jgi:hypothetical protein